jgi:hypothetical protein
MAVKAIIAYYKKFTFKTPAQFEHASDDTDSEDNKSNSWELQATVNNSRTETISVPHSESQQHLFQLDGINPVADSNEIAVSLHAPQGYEHGFLPFCVQARYKLKRY